MCAGGRPAHHMCKSPREKQRRTCAPCHRAVRAYCLTLSCAVILPGGRSACPRRVALGPSPRARRPERARVVAQSRGGVPVRPRPLPADRYDDALQEPNGFRRRSHAVAACWRAGYRWGDGAIHARAMGDGRCRSSRPIPRIVIHESHRVWEGISVGALVRS